MHHLLGLYYYRNTVTPPSWDIADILLEVDSSLYEPSQTTVFIIHGWNDKPKSWRFEDLREALLDQVGLYNN